MRWQFQFIYLSYHLPSQDLLTSYSQITGVSPEIMAILIDYTYTGQVTIDVCNVQDLVLAADLLSFINLRYLKSSL